MNTKKTLFFLLVLAPSLMPVIQNAPEPTAPTATSWTDWSKAKYTDAKNACQKHFNSGRTFSGNKLIQASNANPKTIAACLGVGTAVLVAAAMPNKKKTDARTTVTTRTKEGYKTETIPVSEKVSLSYRLMRPLTIASGIAVGALCYKYNTQVASAISKLGNVIKK